MKRLFVKENTKIASQEFTVFLEQFARGETLESLSLCKRIKSEWWQFVDQRSFFEPKVVERIDGNSLSLHKPPSKPGIYGIFARLKTSDFPLCFYAEILTTDIRSRVRTHLGRDIKENYRTSFRCLEESDENFICSSSVPESEKKNRTRQELELFEHCLT